MNTPFFETLQLLIPVLSVFVSYFLGQRQSARNYFREQAQRRYDTFYVPLFQMFYAGKLWDRDGCSLRRDAREKLLNLFTHNISLLGPGLQSCYPDLLNSHIEMLEAESGHYPQTEADENFNLIFQRIERFAIDEAKELSRVLCLPPISQTYEMRLHALRESRPTQAQEELRSRS